MIMKNRNLIVAYNFAENPIKKNLMIWTLVHVSDAQDLVLQVEFGSYFIQVIWPQCLPGA